LVGKAKQDTGTGPLYSTRGSKCCVYSMKPRSQGKDPEQYIKRISEERRYEDVIDAMERQLERRLLGKWLPRNVTLIYYYTSESSGYPNFVFRFDGESF